MSTFSLYLFTLLPTLHNLFGTIVGLGLIALIIVIIGYIVGCNVAHDSHSTETRYNCSPPPFEDYILRYKHITYLKKSIKWLTVSVVISTLFITFVPSNKDLALIYLGTRITTNEKMIEASENVPEIINLATQYLKTEIEKAIKENK